MKTLLFALACLLTCLVGINSQLTATQDLTAAQEDLSISHAFTEVTIFRSRVQISSIIDRIHARLIEEHISSYAFIKNIGFNVTDSIDAVEETEANERCLNQIRNRWSLKMRRLGNQLSDCASEANFVFTFWNDFINDIYTQAQDAKFLQNLGILALSETTHFTGRNRLSSGIYAIYQELTESFMESFEEFNAFLRQMEDGFDGAIEEFVDCDRRLEEEAVVEQQIHLNHLMRCDHM